MEIKQRMSKRLGWLLGVVTLVLVAFLVACGTTYNSSSDGLLLVGSQGSGLIETFSFDIGNGKVSTISNSPTDTISDVCVLNGVPSSIVIDPAGAYAYTIINANPACTGSVNGIQAIKVNSDGTTSTSGSLVPDPNPVMMAMDKTGKFLFVAEGVQGTVNVYSIGSGATLSLVPGTYTFPPTALVPNIVAVAATPTVFPAIGINGVQNSVCSEPGLNPPTSEYLYAVDSQNYVVYEFMVDMSSGALGNPTNATVVPGFSTDAIPAGVAVDPCDRFVYVSGSKNNRVNAYTICNGYLTQSTKCPLVPDGSLQAVLGSPFELSGSVNGAGPLVVDPYGNFVYVLGTLSNNVSVLKITSTTGSLLNANPATVATGQLPTSIAIRADDSWMFITNLNSPSSVSQYAITPATGALATQAAIPTDNYPWGVAVK